ncbi:MAG: hypothetical protein JWP27_2421 [Flaviaesturariibacter sp.]|nr:hypothetical protein [Flaviaesturariibacter sp.]
MVRNFISSARAPFIRYLLKTTGNQYNTTVPFDFLTIKHLCMKALRITLICLGCALIALNIGQIATSENTPLPIDANFFKIMGIYLSKLYLLFGGIIIAALGSNIHGKSKVNHLA